MRFGILLVAVFSMTLLGVAEPVDTHSEPVVIPNEFIELQSAINARTAESGSGDQVRLNFWDPHTKRATLPAGTVAKVLRVHRLPSNNLGLQVQVGDQKYWIFYRDLPPRNPASNRRILDRRIELFQNDPKGPNPKPISDVNQATRTAFALTRQQVPAVPAPAEKAAPVIPPTNLDPTSAIRCSAALDQSVSGNRRAGGTFAIPAVNRQGTSGVFIYSTLNSGKIQFCTGSADSPNCADYSGSDAKGYMSQYLETKMQKLENAWYIGKNSSDMSAANAVLTDALGGSRALEAAGLTLASGANNLDSQAFRKALQTCEKLLQSDPSALAAAQKVLGDVNRQQGTEIAQAQSIATNPNLFKKAATSNIDIETGIRCANRLNQAAHTGIDSFDGGDTIPVYVRGSGFAAGSGDANAQRVDGTYIFRKDGVIFCQKSYAETVYTPDPVHDGKCQGGVDTNVRANLEQYLIYKMQKMYSAVQALSATQGSKTDRIKSSNAMILDAFAGPGKDVNGSPLDGSAVAGKDWSRLNQGRVKISAKSLDAALIECGRVKDSAAVTDYSATLREAMSGGPGHPAPVASPSGSGATGTY